MSVEINQIPITTTSITSSSFFPLDLATGGSPAYETRKATLNTIANEVLDEQLTGDRFLNINGNVLNLYGGQVSIGTPTASDYALEVDNTTFGGGGSFAGTTIGVTGYSSSGAGLNGESSTGIAVLGQASGGGLGGKFEGGAYIETYGFAGSPNASAVFEASSTTKGALIPRMTTTQRDAISSPATGLEIFNTTTGRFEHYNGTYWAGEKRILYVHHPSYNPSDSQTNFFSNIAIVPVTTTTAHEVILRGNGVIRACDFNTWAATAVGTNEAFSLYIRINSTDYLVQTISAATQKRSFVNTSLNIPFVDGDVLRMNYVTPAWATNPTGLVGAGNLIIE